MIGTQILPKKKHHESDSTPCLMEWKAKKMWTAIKKGEKTLEALTLFSRVMKNISPDQRIHGGGGTARPPSAPLSLACVRRGIENAKHGGLAEVKRKTNGENGSHGGGGCDRRVEGR